MECEKLSDMRGNIEKEGMRSHDHGPVNSHTVLAICCREALEGAVSQRFDLLRHR
jgi:hypothetical protein